MHHKAVHENEPCFTSSHTIINFSANKKSNYHEYVIFVVAIILNAF